MLANIKVKKYARKMLDYIYCYETTIKLIS